MNHLNRARVGTTTAALPVGMVVPTIRADAFNAAMEAESPPLLLPPEAFREPYSCIAHLMSVQASSKRSGCVVTGLDHTRAMVLPASTSRAFRGVQQYSVDAAH